MRSCPACRSMAGSRSRGGALCCSACCGGALSGAPPTSPANFDERLAWCTCSCTSCSTPPSLCCSACGGGALSGAPPISPANFDARLAWWGCISCSTPPSLCCCRALCGPRPPPPSGCQEAPHVRRFRRVQAECERAEGRRAVDVGLGLELGLGLGLGLLLFVENKFAS